MAKHRTGDEIRTLLKGVAVDRAKGLTVGQACRKQGVSEQSAAGIGCVRRFRAPIFARGVEVGRN